MPPSQRLVCVVLAVTLLATSVTAKDGSWDFKGYVNKKQVVDDAAKDPGFQLFAGQKGNGNNAVSSVSTCSSL
jgi:hypothetical protein